MVRVLFLFFVLINSLQIREAVSQVELKVLGNFKSVEVTEFPYEGVIVIDINGDLNPFESGDFQNSFIKAVEFKRFSSKEGRLKILTQGPFSVISKSKVNDGFLLVLKPEVSFLSVSPVKRYSVSSTVSTPAQKIQIVRDTILVTKQRKVFLRFNGLTDEELIQFVKVSTGVDLSIKKSGIFSGSISCESESLLPKKLDEYLKNLK